MQQNGEDVQHLEGVSGFHDNELHWYRKFRGIDNDRDQNFLSSLIGTNAQEHTVLCADKLTEGNTFLNITNAR